MEKDDLRTFMCDGIASKIDSDALWNGLERLRTDWQMEKDDLRTFMCNGIASKIGSAALWDGLERLRTALGTSHLSTVMNNSLAAITSYSAHLDAVLAVQTALKNGGWSQLYGTRFLRTPYVQRKRALLRLHERITTHPQPVEYLSEYRGKTHAWHKARAIELNDEL